MVALVIPPSAKPSGNDDPISGRYILQKQGSLGGIRTRETDVIEITRTAPDSYTANVDFIYREGNICRIVTHLKRQGNRLVDPIARSSHRDHGRLCRFSLAFRSGSIAVSDPGHLCGAIFCSWNFAFHDKPLRYSRALTLSERQRLSKTALD